MNNSPPISIVTGFLGSGKTTMLRRMIERGFGERRVALVVNEIGAIGFDGELLEGHNVERMIELTGGCICCSVGTDFLLAVEELVETVAPDLIIVETTGLAEPWGIVRQVRAGGLALDAVVALVDAANIGRALDLSPVAHAQVRAADFLILNKCDLASPAQLAEARAQLHALNARAAIIPAVMGDIAVETIFGLGLGESLVVEQPDQAHLAHEGMAALTWQLDGPLERERLMATLATLPTQLYRAKGIVHCTDVPWATRLSLVCGRIEAEDVRLREAPSMLNRLVLIGPGLTELRDDIFARLDACADTAERAAAWQMRRV